MKYRHISLLLLFLIGPRVAWATCSYDLFDWDTTTKQATNRRVIKHDQASLARKEIDPQTGCQVCQEDQVRLAVRGIPEVLVCKHLASTLETALNQVVKSGFVIKEVSGYRVGKTRGEVDKDGLRTEFSNHSYGTAIDFNASWNGLYSECSKFGPTCRLIRGGPWRPDLAFGVSLDKAIVSILEKAGLKWGGQIAGRQKDFMHFSPTGY